MTASSGVSSPTELRLMPFGQTAARDVRDPLWEPLWGGQRVLAQVFGGRVTFRDEHHEALTGYDGLREAILQLAAADELVIDGYLQPAPLGGVAAEPPSEMDGVTSVAGVGRRLFLGGLGRSSRRDEILAGNARRIEVRSDAPTAIVAVDLLWLDGESIIDVPLAERKRLLESALLDGEIVRRTVAVRPPVKQWFEQWRAFGFIELAAKGANSRYTPGRPNGEWARAFIPKR